MGSELTVPELLRAAAATFEQRSRVYGDSYKQFGAVMQALFPDGMYCETEDEFQRMGVLVQCVSKLMRYARNVKKGGHVDSALDLCVYAAMLGELTHHDLL